LAAAAASGHGKLLRGEPLAELEKTRPLSQEKFDEQYPANLLNELKGFELVKYRAEREKVLRESHIKAIAFNEVLERYSSEAVLAVTAALKECPGMLDRLRESCPLMRPTVAEDGTVGQSRIEGQYDGLAMLKLYLEFLAMLTREDEIKAHMDVLYNAERSPCPNNVSIAQYTARIADIEANHNRHLIDHGVGLTGWRLALFYVGQLPDALRENKIRMKTDLETSRPTSAVATY